mmetsp:Transcript_9529/g.24876  ORF Transcript_9529/g.24876 Transcript_9529/m.24876 type:complete len:238 (+) Transcript_9529:285-998(+)
MRVHQEELLRVLAVVDLEIVPCAKLPLLMPVKLDLEELPSPVGRLPAGPPIPSLAQAPDGLRVGHEAHQQAPRPQHAGDVLEELVGGLLAAPADLQLAEASNHVKLPELRPHAVKDQVVVARDGVELPEVGLEGCPLLVCLRPQLFGGPEALVKWVEAEVKLGLDGKKLRSVRPGAAPQVADEVVLLDGELHEDALGPLEEPLGLPRGGLPGHRLSLPPMQRILLTPSSPYTSAHGI